MNLTNLTKIALKALNNNKMRCFLTMLGIIIGVASVITMLAIGQGSKRSIRAQIAEMGSNMIMIHPGNMERGGVRQDASSMQTLKLNDYQDILDNTEYVSACSPSVSSSGQFIYGNENTPSTIYGVNQDYLEIRQISVADGEVFTDSEVKTSAKVCILGQTVVDNLFPDGSDPIGKVVRFNSIPFRVIGVLKKKGYNIFATGGSSKFLTENGIENTRVYWPSEEGHPQALEMLHKKEIDMVVNIPRDLSAGELDNGYKIRRAAVDLNIPLVTNARLASAFIHAFCTMTIDDIAIKSWDEYK